MPPTVGIKFWENNFACTTPTMLRWHLRWRWHFCWRNLFAGVGHFPLARGL
jgi:hypothetical protein